MLTTLTALVGLPLILLGAASSAFPLRNDPSGRFTRRTINSTSAAASYDFVIVGGGTAGLVLANRLTETNLTVLVLEDGTSPSEVNAYQAPGANQQVLGSSIDWGFVTAPQVGLDDRQITYNRGRCLGGSSAINGLTYMRGSPGIYDRWAGLGNLEWTWDEVYAYFRKSTRFVPPSSNGTLYAEFDSNAYSSDGPLPVAYADYVYDSANAFVEGMQEIGIPYNPELNNGTNVGAKREPFTSDGFRRASSYDAYYLPAENRTNLHVATRAQVQSIILEQKVNGSLSATGVVYNDIASGMTLNVSANFEVILSAGAIQTPQVLMLSGIGPKSELERVGIPMQLENANIGQHMQDHTYFSIIATAQEKSSHTSVFRNYAKLQAAQDEYSKSFGGPLNTPIGPSFAFEQLNASTLQSIGAEGLLDRTNISLVEYLIETDYFPAVNTQLYPPFPNQSYISLTAAIIAPTSRGNVTLRSSTISDAPVINPNFLGSADDRTVALRSFHRLRELLATTAFNNIVIGDNHGEVSPGVQVQSDEDIEQFIVNTSITIWHASGTCRMMPEEQGGVVDNRLRLHGVDQLRIVDASIFPLIIDGHPQGAVYMVAEKAADMIKEDWKLI